MRQVARKRFAFLLHYFPWYVEFLQLLNTSKDDPLVNPPGLANHVHRMNAHLSSLIGNNLRL